MSEVRAAPRDAEAAPGSRAAVSFPRVDAYPDHVRDGGLADAAAAHHEGDRRQRGQAGQPRPARVSRRRDDRVRAGLSGRESGEPVARDMAGGAGGGGLEIASPHAPAAHEDALFQPPRLGGARRARHARHDGAAAVPRGGHAVSDGQHREFHRDHSNTLETRRAPRGAGLHTGAVSHRRRRMVLAAAHPDVSQARQPHGEDAHDPRRVDPRHQVGQGLRAGGAQVARVRRRQRVAHEDRRGHRADVRRAFSR